MVFAEKEYLHVNLLAWGYRGEVNDHVYPWPPGLGRLEPKGNFIYYSKG